MRQFIASKEGGAVPSPRMRCVLTAENATSLPATAVHSEKLQKFYKLCARFARRPESQTLSAAPPVRIASAIRYKRREIAFTEVRFELQDYSAAIN